MADMIPFEMVDYLAEAQARVTEQFKDSKDAEKIKPIFNKYLKLLMASQLELQNTLRDLTQLRDIDNAIGVQLDVIGRIVGQERELVEAELYPFFAFQGVVGALGFGSKETGGGGTLTSKSGGVDTGKNVLLDDETYRKYIRAKIFKNITASTPEQFMAVVNSIFGTERCYVAEGEDAEITVYFDRNLSDLEKNLLDYVSHTQKYPTRLLPKTVGVKVNYDYTGIPNFLGAGYGRAYGEFYGL